MQIQCQLLLLQSQMPKETVVLSGVEVIHTTEKAILIGYSDGDNDIEKWIPRSLCMDGDTLDVGDNDVVVDQWYAMKEMLPYA